MLVVAGITSTVTWLSAALPSERTTHVDIWPPLALGVVIIIAGIYAIAASDNQRLWLPGRKTFLKEQKKRFLEQIPEVWNDPGHQIAQAITELTKAVNRLAPPDKESKA